MHCNEYTLPNGLRIIHEPTLSKVAYCGFAIDAGTRDEAANEQGMAHFVEHLIFKGTVKRKAWHILNRMENVGGDLNAYTNKEETVVYSAFLSSTTARPAFSSPAITSSLRLSMMPLAIKVAPSAIRPGTAGARLRMALATMLAVMIS